jgi:hypothetical protein
MDPQSGLKPIAVDPKAYLFFPNCTSYTNYRKVTKN